MNESAFDRQSSINTVNPFFNLETGSGNHKSRRTRTSYLVLGNEIEVDEGLQYRVTLGQRLGASFGIVSVICFIISDVFFNHQNIFIIKSEMIKQRITTTFISFNNLRIIANETFL